MANGVRIAGKAETIHQSPYSFQALVVLITLDISFPGPAGNDQVENKVRPITNKIGLAEVMPAVHAVAA
jgi:hypothetical protein